MQFHQLVVHARKEKAKLVGPMLSQTSKKTIWEITRSVFSLARQPLESFFKFGDPILNCAFETSIVGPAP